MFFLLCTLFWTPFLSAHADAGLPLLVFLEPLFVFLLLPVIFIEAYRIRVQLKSKWTETLKAVTLSNLGSTLIGIPLAWALLVGVELVLMLFTSFFFNPSFQTSTYISLLAPAWLVPLTTWGIKEKLMTLWSISYLLVYFYFVSSWIETKINGRVLKGHEKNLVKRATWNANRYSYGFLFFILMIYFLWSSKLNSEWINKIHNLLRHFFLSLFFPN
jgi:hypothetical protein